MKLRDLTIAIATVHLRKRGRITDKTAHNAWPEAERETAIAMQWQGKSKEEIAKALGRSVSGVYHQIGRAA